jgi:hypothetical protein
MGQAKAFVPLIIGARKHKEFYKVQPIISKEKK